MELDKTYIAIRERDYLDILDLSLSVLRVHFFPLLLVFFLGALPFIVLCHAALGGFDPNELTYDELDYSYGWHTMNEMWWRVARVCELTFYIIILLPLATAPATLYLGQTLFAEKIDAIRLFRDYITSLPQLILLQLFVRTILTMVVVTAWIPFTVWPYLNEIILLERNPLWRRKDRKMTTLRRSSALHGSSSGDLFGRWVTAMFFAAGMASCLLFALWAVKFWTSGNAEISRLTFLIYLQIAVWMTVCYFTVVRFLSYLDLRIRREGWEVELKMRAEAARLASPLA